MKYRILGRTGLKVSELGIGGHEYRRWLPHQKLDSIFLKTQPQRNKIIKTAIDAGVNFFDTTMIEEAESLGLALKATGKREDVYIAAMILFPFRLLKDSPRSKWRDIMLSGFEEVLAKLQTDHLDIYNILQPEDNYSLDRLRITLETLDDLKNQDRIGHIAASAHNLNFLAELMRKHDCFDSIMIPYNYHLQAAKDTIFPLCKLLNVGVVSMKPFAWPYYGIPFVRFDSVEAKKCSLTPIQTSLRWILKSPEVSTIVASVNSLSELRENLDAICREEDPDEEILRKLLREAQDPLADKKLDKMVTDPALDISNFAKERTRSPPSS